MSLVSPVSVLPAQHRPADRLARALAGLGQGAFAVAAALLMVLHLDRRSAGSRTAADGASMAVTATKPRQQTERSCGC
jgi:hypothetical protein